MKIFQWFLGFMIVFWLIIIAIWLTPEPWAVSGQPHPEYSTMLKSGESVSSMPTIKWLSYLFGLGIFGIICFMVLIGARKKDPAITKKIHQRILISFAVIILVYSLMVFSYWHYASGSSVSYFGGLPTPTSWMIYGVWFAPLLLVIIYFSRFSEWVISPEELDQFHKIVAKRKAREGKK